MIRTVLVARVAVAAAMLAAVANNLVTGLNSGDFVFWNFFGYFTIQNNLIGAAVLLTAARLTARERPAWLEYARASVAVYLVITVTVYWIMLAPTDDEVWTWNNLVLHGLSGVALLADYLLEGPRRTLPLAGVWVVMAYPSVWLVVVLIRGATDGWFPYPFLDPDTGYASIATVIAGIFVAGIGLGALLFTATRWRVVTPA